jgi:hypothetical protein
MIKVEDHDLRILNWVGWTVEYLPDKQVKLSIPFHDEFNFINELQAEEYLDRIRKEYTDFIAKKNEVYTLIDSFAKVKSRKAKKCKNENAHEPPQMITFMGELRAPP